MRMALIRQRYTHYGGAERFVAGALDALAQQGAQLVVIAREWQPQPGITWLPANPFYLGRRWRDRSFSRRACQWVKQGNFDLVQSHERLDCCDIYRAGDGVHREWLRQRARTLGIVGRFGQWLSPYHRYILRAERNLFTSQHLRAVICNSAMVRDEISAHFGPIPARIEVIYNAVDIQRFSPTLRLTQRTRILSELSIPETATVFLFVGSGFARKGLATTLRALAGLPRQAHLLVVGRDRHAHRYQRLARRLGVWSRVRFLGQQRDAAPFYGAADALVLPTLYDPFPNVILEAMACALPVITSFKCGAIDWIHDGENGFICTAQDVAGVAARMRLLLDMEYRERIGKAGLALVENRSIKKMAQQLLNLYADLL